MPKLRAQVMIHSSGGFVESGAYQSPTTRSISVQFFDEAGNVASVGCGISTKFITDRPGAVELEWNNPVEGLYDNVKVSGEGNLNHFTTVHEADEDVVARIGCIIIDEFGFAMKADPAIVTVLGPYDGWE